MKDKSEPSCYFCGSQENLHEHHIIPDKLNPPEEIQDTETLCRSCHGKLHGKFLDHLIDYMTPRWLLGYYMQKMLDLAAEYEKENRPYVYSFQGFDRRDLEEYSDEEMSIMSLDELRISEFVLRKLESDGYFDRVNTRNIIEIRGVYRLSSTGWRRANIDEPDVPIEADVDELGCPECGVCLADIESDEVDGLEEYICECGWEGSLNGADYIGTGL